METVTVVVGESTNSFYRVSIELKGRSRACGFDSRSGTGRVGVVCRVRQV